MLVERHNLGAQSLVSTARVRGVGGLLDYILFPLPTVIDAYNRAGEPEPSSTLATPKPTFASSFGSALGETTGQFLVTVGTIAAVAAAGYWFLFRRK